MALVKCPECGREISTAARSCPGCGYQSAQVPAAPPPLQPQPPQKTSKGLIALIGCLIAIPVVLIGVAFIGLLAAIAIPSFMKARETSQRKTCLRNLRLIEETKAEWAVQHNATNNVAIPEEEFEKLLAKKHPQPLVCPQDPEKSFSTSYDINLTGVAPACRCDESHVLGYYEYSEEETTGPPEDGD